MKNFRKILSLLLAVIMIAAVSTAAFAEDDVKAEKKITILCQNVAGLPIPSMFADDGKKIPITQKVIGQELNSIGADVVCVQEDFQFHSILGELTFDMTDYVKPDMELNPEVKKSAWWSFTHTVKMFARSLSLLLTDLFDKLISGELTK